MELESGKYKWNKMNLWNFFKKINWNKENIKKRIKNKNCMRKLKWKITIEIYNNNHFKQLTNEEKKSK